MATETSILVRPLRMCLRVVVGLFGGGVAHVSFSLSPPPAPLVFSIASKEVVLLPQLEQNFELGSIFVPQ
jgi:hypothetical protein